MAKRLTDNINNAYLEAAARMRSAKARKRVVVYVESYDDIFFWRTILDQVKSDRIEFKVMLPSRTTLHKGKKTALMHTLSAGFGHHMIACVDADYDYLMQGANVFSAVVCQNPYVFHTYAYAIENLQCYAPTLHNVCVMSTLNDHRVFDFETFLEVYSTIIHPLWIWSVWCYRYGYGDRFSMADMARITEIPTLDINKPQTALADLRHRVNVRLNTLMRTYPQAKRTMPALRQAIEALGITPETTYLYVRGHDLLERTISPLVQNVCRILNGEHRRAISRMASHATQYANELSGYSNATGEPTAMLRKHTDYLRSPICQRIIADLQAFVDHEGAPLPNAPRLNPIQDTAANI